MSYLAKWVDHVEKSHAHEKQVLAAIWKIGDYETMSRYELKKLVLVMWMTLNSGGLGIPSEAELKRMTSRLIRNNG